MNKQGFSALAIILIVAGLAVVGGGVYFLFRNQQPTLPPTTSSNQQSTTTPPTQPPPAQKVEEKTDTPFDILIQGDVKNVTEDFIPFKFSESQLQRLPDAVVIKFKAKNSSAADQEISLTKDSWHVPVLYLSPKMTNGLYDVEVFAAEYGMYTNNLTSLYKTKVTIERKIAGSGLVSVEQKYPPQKDGWEGVNIQPFTAGKEIKFLEFEISNKTNSAMRIQAFEMGTEAGGKANFIKSFSIYDSSNGNKLSSLSDLFQSSQTMLDYNIHYLDNPVEIDAGKSLRLELRGVAIPEFLPSDFKSGLVFSFNQVFGKVGSDVVRKEIYMTPRAKIQ